MIKICGICGFAGLNDRNLLIEMTEALTHRGPDAEGFFMDGFVGLGHRRLSIIDLETGNQPIHNEDESIYVIFNGEIYNFKALREDLEHKGHRFYTSTDTEVIVHGYEEYGSGFLDKISGMFAFALLDLNEKKLLLARDRLGIKPLYYTKSKPFLFSSELKSILKYKEFIKNINIPALYDYLTFGYIPSPKTIFEGILKIEPGYYLIYEMASNKLIKRPYWELVINKKKYNNDVIKTLDTLLEQSIKQMLISDVPLGAYLSGGLDSSTVVAYMSKLMDEPVKTFSISFDYEGIDESKYSRLVSEHFGTDHHEIKLSYDVIKLLPKIVYHFDEPFSDAASLPTYLMSEVTRKYVKVVLTGEGSDELFLGYRGFSSFPRRNKIRKAIPSPLISISKKIFPDHAYYIDSLKDEAQFFSIHMSNPYVAKQLLSKELPGDLVSYLEYSPVSIISKNFNKIENNDFLMKMQYFNIKTALSDGLLMKVDKTTMANSIEARVPFLDHKLVEFAVTIPENWLLHKGIEKYILKLAVKDMLPKEIIDRKKHAFDVPIKEWMYGELLEYSKQVLSSEELRKHGLIDVGEVQKLFEKHRRKIKTLNTWHKIWNLLLFQIWYKTYME